MPHRRTLLLAGSLLLSAFWTTPGRPAAPCDPADGLRLLARADARDSGYLLSSDEAGHSVYFRHAVYDLVQGRIRLFELAGADGIVRYTLRDATSTQCIARRRVDTELAGLPIPAGRCVAAEAVSLPLSRYLIEGYPGTRERIPDRVTVSDRQTGAVLTEFRRPRFAWLTGRSACLREAAGNPGHPLWNLSSFVFPDGRGDVFSLADLDWVRQQHAEGADMPEVLPPPSWVKRRLAEDGVRMPDACTLPGWMGATEVHAIELDRGPLEVEARLDAESSSAGMVILDVHAPGRAVVILARARSPTVWHVHESGRSSVVAMLVRGDHGQAVVGLSRYSRILMSTRRHNPYTNCTELELSDIEQQVIRLHGITRTQRQEPGKSPATVRYGIGEPMPDGGELFYYDNSLSDFEVR